MSVSRKGVDVDILESTDSASQTEGLELKGNEVRELLMRLMGGGGRGAGTGKKHQVESAGWRVFGDLGVEDGGRARDEVRQAAGAVVGMGRV